MSRAFAVTTLATLLVAGAAYAQSAKYVWTGYGTNVPGSSKCPTYKMTINVTVAGDSVKALFEQEGRTERHFSTAVAPSAAVPRTVKSGWVSSRAANPARTTS